MSGALKKVLLLALGGEGGGTLAQWVVEAGLECQWPIQATSIPGVAQRTGATSYYIECLPRQLHSGEIAPPMCLAPLAGDVDLVVSSELLETARAAERGFCTESQTRVVTSSSRALTIEERISTRDGRESNESLLELISKSSTQHCVFDMTQAARDSGTIVSSVMFGALVATGVLAFPKELCLKLVATDANRRGFEAGYSAVGGKVDVSIPASPRALNLNDIIALGKARLTDYQDAAYAAKFQSLVAALTQADNQAQAITCEAARGLALWMAYEDVIRVADLKSRKSRFEEIRSDYKPKAGEPLVVRDFLKPGIEEIAAIVPASFAKALSAWAQKRKIQTIGEGIQLETSSVRGLLTMRFLAKLRWLRPRSSRFSHEQALIARWHAGLLWALQNDRKSAVTIAKLPQLIRGYSDTFGRGQKNFITLLETLVEPAMQGQGLNQLAASLEKGYTAASASPDSNALFTALGIAAPAPKEQVIKFVAPQIRRAKADH